MVTRDGFTVDWDEPGEEGGTVVEVTISGLVTYYREDGTTEIDGYEVSLTNLADDGDAAASQSNLTYFLVGDLRVTLRRVQTISYGLGFAEGTIRLEVSRGVSLTLEEPDDE